MIVIVLGKPGYCQRLNFKPDFSLLCPAPYNWLLMEKAPEPEGEGFMDPPIDVKRHRYVDISNATQVCSTTVTAGSFFSDLLTTNKHQDNSLWKN